MYFHMFKNLLSTEKELDKKKKKEYIGALSFKLAFGNFMRMGSEAEKI